MYGQVVAGLDVRGVRALLGRLLTLQAQAQNLTLVADPATDEAYTRGWTE